MFPQKICLKISLSFFLLIYGIIISICGSASAFTFPSWWHGPSGYESAYSDAKENEKPLIVYFHIEGSVWNERMSDEYLASVPVDDYLTDIPKVEINGEGTNGEEKLVSEYKVKQFPAFLVLIPAFNDEYIRVHPFADKDMSVEEFLNKLKEVIGYQYSSKAFSCFEKKNYDDALKYYEMSSQYNPGDANTYYSIGMIYNYKYYNKNKSIEFLKNARENYKKSIELNPDNEESKAELEKVEKELEKY